MSKSVVTAASAAHARRLGQKKLIKKAEDQNPAQDDQQAVDGKEEAAKAVQTENGISQQTSMSDAPLGAFSFEGALAAASAGLAGEASAQDDSGMTEEDGDGSGTILLVGAVALAAAGIAVAVSGGGNSNEAPVLADITAKTTAEDTVLTFPVTATDPDGDALTFSVGSVTGGTATVANGTVTFTPTANFNGAASLVVTVTDSEGLTDTQTVNITVSPVADAPTIATITAPAVTEDTAVVIPVTATDPDGGAVTVTVGNVTGGTAVVGTNGAITFTPNANYSGPASLVVTATDSSGATATQTVNLTVAAVNDAPVAGPLTTTTITTNEDTPAEFVIDAVDPDTPDSGLTVTLTDAPDHGDIGPDGTTYIPDDGFFGTDSFTYQVSDGTSSYTQTVAITVTEGPAGPARVSIDAGTPSVTVTVGDGVAPPTGDVNLDSGSFILTDDATVNTNVLLKNFGSNDSIEVDGIASRNAYSFSTGAGAGGADDLSITAQQSDGTVTQITIEDIIVNSGPIFSYETAVAALGFEFMTIA